MTVTIGIITAGSAITGITKRTARFLQPSSKRKEGSLAAPLFAFLLCRLGSAQKTRMFRERRAPRERCDQLLFSSKPGGVMIPLPELDELTNCLYAAKR